MAIAIVEELWGRIRAHIDDKITAAKDASESAEAAATRAEQHEAGAASAAAGAAEGVRSELDNKVSAAEAAATRAEQHEAGAASAAAAEVEKLKGDAPEAFDTLGEIAAELAANESERSALTNSIAAKADKVHGHTVDQVTGLQDELDGKAPVSHDHTVEQVTGLRGELDGKAPVSHDHTIAQVAGLEAALTAAGTAEHTHPQSDVDGLGAALDGKADADHTHTPESIGAAPASHTHSQYATTTQVDGKADKTHTHTASQISDATATGRSVLTASSQANARSAIGAGTSNLALGTTSSTAAAGNHTHSASDVGAAPASHTHTASQISDATATGRSVLTASSQANARSAIGAGTSNLALGTTSSTAAAGNHTHTAASIGAASTSHTHTVNQVTGLQSALDGKANTGDVPVVDAGYNSFNADDPATDYPQGVSYSMHNGVSYGWNTAIEADTGYASFGSFVLVQTLRQGTYSKSTTQLVFAYNDEHKPVFMRKWYGEAWGPFRSLTDDGHKHTSADLTDVTDAVQRNAGASGDRLVKTRSDGMLHMPHAPSLSTHPANKAYVDGRTPEVRVVSSLPASPTAGVIYMVTG